jgi:hypothetical protein
LGPTDKRVACLPPCPGGPPACLQRGCLPAHQGRQALRCFSRRFSPQSTGSLLSLACYKAPTQLRFFSFFLPSRLDGSTLLSHLTSLFSSCCRRRSPLLLFHFHIWAEALLLCGSSILFTCLRFIHCTPYSDSCVFPLKFLG